jgi:thiamine-phosphate pyrophosphorylase
MIDFHLCFVTDGSSPETVASACASGLRAVQYRDKHALGRSAWEVAGQLRDITIASGTRLLINDRVDVAKAVRADGVHCPEEGFPPDEARGVLGATGLIGASTHSAETVRRAAEEGADFVFFGPVFDTPSKAAFGKPQGLAALRKISDSVDIPVFAIGGITPGNARTCLDHGAHGVAVISAIADAPDVAVAVRSLAETIGTL